MSKKKKSLATDDTLLEEKDYGYSAEPVEEELLYRAYTSESAANKVAAFLSKESGWKTKVKKSGGSWSVFYTK